MEFFRAVPRSACLRGFFARKNRKSGGKRHVRRQECPLVSCGWKAVENSVSLFSVNKRNRRSLPALERGNVLGVCTHPAAGNPAPTVWEYDNTFSVLFQGGFQILFTEKRLADWCKRQGLLRRSRGKRTYSPPYGMDFWVDANGIIMRVRRRVKRVCWTISGGIL